jgi:ribosomal protein S10
MKNKTLIIPLYCPNCDNLIYLANRYEKSDQLVEYQDGDWIEHPCTSIKRGKIWQDQLIYERQNLVWGLERLPFSPRTEQRNLKANRAIFGVVSSIYEMDDHCNLRVYTDERVLIDIKVREQRKELSAGMLLDLKHLQRIGKGRYRLPTLTEFKLPDFVPPLSIVPDLYLELILKAKDQRLLETFTKRFLQHFLEKGAAAFAVYPLPLTSEGENTIHSRCINFPSRKDLTTSFKDISLPNSVQITIREIKNSKRKGPV